MSMVRTAVVATAMITVAIAGSWGWSAYQTGAAREACLKRLETFATGENPTFSEDLTSCMQAELITNDEVADAASRLETLGSGAPG